MKITARQVAEAAGASLSAVSRAFVPGSPLAEDRRQHILNVARDLGYVSPAGRSIGRLAKGSISLVAGDLSNPFYVNVMELLSHALNARGQRLVLHAIPPGGSVDLVMRHVLSYGADAAIVTSARMSSEIARACRRQGMPVVLFNRVQPDAQMAAVTCDNYHGSARIAARFLASGRRRIAHVTGLRDTSTHLERNRGFLDRLLDADLHPVASACGDFTYAGAQDAVRVLLDQGVPFDAMFCENDIMALAAADALRAAGRHVGEDVALIGFDDIPMAAWDSYRLTTFHQPVQTMVVETLDLLDRLVANPGTAGDIRVLPGHIVERATG
ncbi:substrate-binding domain-containing protein [Falsirhodobacter halotolerans]|uniref:LacI family DNA-binding transcriptional regulator n=1 Tax=Falsirhodobacter halotolerans TaxID=1146892 RepID=UPI001FD0B9E3|nr:substrate-binding domain-containing protein [Falsirhodobacter halotolerans]MCJ8140963.1 substrate-binding domain-containing protein [Falsirhodobacter halotolerans]